jgi:hypothetical protein
MAKIEGTGPRPKPRRARAARALPKVSAPALRLSEIVGGVILGNLIISAPEPWMQATAAIGAMFVAYMAGRDDGRRALAQELLPLIDDVRGVVDRGHARAAGPTPPVEPPEAG